MVAALVVASAPSASFAGHWTGNGPILTLEGYGYAITSSLLVVV